MLKQEKKNAISICKQLYYPKETITKIQNAVSIEDISRIMKNARLSWIIGDR